MWNPLRLFFAEDSDGEIDHSFTSLVGNGTSIANDEMCCSDTLRVDGTISIKTLRSTNGVIVSDTGSINAEKIYATTAIIDGRVNSSIYADQIYLLEHAELNGDIFVGANLSIESGARFNGCSHFNDPTEEKEFEFTPIST